MSADPMLPIGSNRCFCSGCNRYFSSVGSFTKHRTDGRCRDEREMIAAGMSINAKGYWVTEAWVERGT